MDYRKIIRFGTNSFVVSLPNEWVKNNRIKKGDIVAVDYENNELKIALHQKQEENSYKISEALIDYDKLKDFTYLKPYLTSAYINGYDQITIIGKNLAKESQKIRELIKEFIALEIIEQSSQKIILREFVNIREVSFEDAIRRMDRIILSMAEDCEKHLTKKGNYIQMLKEKDADIFKVYNLIFRSIKYAIKPENRNVLKLKPEEILYYWELTIFMEKFADQLKRMPKYIHTKAPSNMMAMYKRIIENYKAMMHAHYKKDISIAIELASKRKEMFEECEEIAKTLPKNAYISTEKMKTAIDLTSHLAKTLLKYKY